jgi:glycosyltransferase involved in cell wall biosynthesis
MYVAIFRIIPNPSTIYLSMTRAICATSSRVIVLADLGRRLLIDVYGVEESKISVVPHGVPDVPFSPSLASAKNKLGLDADTPTMATFGLLHRNKNIELGLDALVKVAEVIPDVKYLVIGQTHPAVQAYEGESYRRELESNVTKLGLEKNVMFIDKYVSDDELLEYLGAADIYLTPYAREDQYVSGTLSWAVGLGKAVVSTPYLYAKELLADGRGFLVPFQDHQFLGDTIIKLFSDDNMRDTARRLAHEFSRDSTWSNIGNQLENMHQELILTA